MHTLLKATYFRISHPSDDAGDPDIHAYLNVDALSLDLRTVLSQVQSTDPWRSGHTTRYAGVS